MRHGLAFILLLGGCYDFEGDLGRIGFSSNLVTDGRTWQPDMPIADRTIARFDAEHRVGDEEETPLDVRGGSDLDVVEQDGTIVAITGEGTRGTVRFDGEEHDRFRVRFARAEQVVLTQPFVDEAITHVAEGAQVWVVPSVRDRRGRSLGYDPDQLELDATGGGSVASEGGSLYLVGDTAGIVGIEASLDGVWLPSPDLRVVAAGDIVQIEVETFRLDLEIADVCGAIAVGWTADGDRVLGPDVSWEWVGGEVETDTPPDVLMWDCEAPPEQYGLADG